MPVPYILSTSFRTYGYENSASRPTISNNAKVTVEPETPAQAIPGGLLKAPLIPPAVE